MRRIAAILSITLLNGCVPMGGSFLRFEREGATYYPASCFGTQGPPSVTVFGLEGISLSARIDTYHGLVRIGVHVPERQTVQIQNRWLDLNYGGQAYRVALRPVAHVGGSGEHYIFRYADPYGKEDYFGPLTGGTKEITFSIGTTRYTAHKRYDFVADLDKHLPLRWVQLPPLTINGKFVEGPMLEVRTAKYAEFAQIYCP